MYSFQKAVNKLRKYYKVNQIFANRFVFINILSKDSRYIANFNNSMKKSKEKYLLLIGKLRN